MNFLLGLMVGMAISSSGDVTLQAQRMLADIPFRCLALFEKDVNEYLLCRRPTIQQHIRDLYHSQCATGWDTRQCQRDAVEQNLKWEVEGLHQLVEIAKGKNK